MTFFGKAMRAFAVILAIGAGSMTAKPAKADGGAVIAGIAGGLILGTIIGSTANAKSYGHHQVKPYGYHNTQSYYVPPQRSYYAPAPVYQPRSYYSPNVTFSFGSGYYNAPKRYRSHRGHGYRHYRGHRGHRPIRRHYRRHH